MNNHWIPLDLFAPMSRRMSSFDLSEGQTRRPWPHRHNLGFPNSRMLVKHRNVPFLHMLMIRKFHPCSQPSNLTPSHCIIYSAQKTIAPPPEISNDCLSICHFSLSFVSETRLEDQFSLRMIEENRLTDDGNWSVNLVCPIECCLRYRNTLSCTVRSSPAACCLLCAGLWSSNPAPFQKRRGDAR